MNSCSLDHENAAKSLGHHLICGVDEAGRGPLAGPVVAAAVILDMETIPEGLNDSKKISPKKRLAIYHALMESAHIGIASASAERIDQMNILQASLWAMEEAIAHLSVKADYALIDGRDIPKNLKLNGKALIGGDGLSVSIAAASIIAKVTRDQMMIDAADHHPFYGFERHKGYGTKMHREAIKTHGFTKLHRKSFHLKF